MTFDKSLVSAIKWYTGLEENEQVNNKKHINTINRAFTKVPPLTEELIVYRGVKKFDDLLENFISTSLSMKEALKFSSGNCCLFRIKVLPGSKVLPIFFYSLYKDEMEILLDSNAYFYFTNTPSKYNGINVYDVYYKNKKLQKNKRP